MEATLLGSHRFHPNLFATKPLIPDGHVACDLPFYHPLYAKPHHTLKMKLVNPSRSHFVLPNRCFQSRTNRKWSMNSPDQLRSDYINVKSSSSESLNLEVVPSSSNAGADISNYNGVNSLETLHATLGLGSSTERAVLQCSVGHRSPIILCSLLPNQIETCSLDLKFDEYDDLVAFSVIGT